MKKYLQITVVLTIFGLLVFLRQVWGKEDMPVVENKTLQSPTVINLTPASQLQIKTKTPLPSSGPQTQAIAKPTAQPTSAPNMPMMQMGRYKNGTYTGSVADAFYGNLQVQAVITNGKISNVVFLQYPSDNNTSQYVNGQAMPLLTQEAIQTQSAQVDIISGASSSSQAFQHSLADALDKAK